MKYVVYIHTNVINGKSYVGLTKVRSGVTPFDAMMGRWNGHLYAAKRDIQFLFSRAIRKYGANAFTHDVLDVLATHAGVEHAEVLWIAKRKTYAYDDDGHGYNMTRGGAGSSGTKHTFEQSLAKSKRQIGSKRGSVTRLRQSVTKLGNKNPQYGKRHTEEHKKHMSEIMRGRPSHFKGKPWCEARRVAYEAKRTTSS